MLVYELLTGASPFTLEGERNNQQEISKRILRAEPPIPSYLSPNVQDFLRSLLVREPRNRLGYNGAASIKAHPFFAEINWRDLAERRVPAPFKPKISHELDVSNFSEEFTKLEPNISKLIAEDKNKQQAQQQQPQVMVNVADFEHKFANYNYISPSVVLDQQDSEETSQRRVSAAEISDNDDINSENKKKTRKKKKTVENKMYNEDDKSDSVIFLSSVPPTVTSDKIKKERKSKTKKQHFRNVKPDGLAAKLAEKAASVNAGNTERDFYKHYYLDEDGRLGNGSYSICRKARHLVNGQEYAVKIVASHMRRDSLKGSTYDAATREVQMLQACGGHPNIVQLVDWYQDEAKTYLVLELLRGGELLSRIRRQGKFNEQEAWPVFKQLVMAVEYLHSKGIVHLDLKPEVGFFHVHSCLISVLFCF